MADDSLRLLNRPQMAFPTRGRIAAHYARDEENNINGFKTLYDVDLLREGYGTLFRVPLGGFLGHGYDPNVSQNGIDITLPDNTEVMIIFEDGDWNRPFIAFATPMDANKRTDPTTGQLVPIAHSKDDEVDGVAPFITTFGGRTLQINVDGTVTSDLLGPSTVTPGGIDKTRTIQARDRILLEIDPGTPNATGIELRKTVTGTLAYITADFFYFVQKGTTSSDTLSVARKGDDVDTIGVTGLDIAGAGGRHYHYYGPAGVSPTPPVNILVPQKQEGHILGGSAIMKAPKV